LLAISAIGTMGIMCTLMLCINLAREVPINYILLGSFTLMESYMVSFTCSAYDPQIVLMAALMTLAVTISLTVYAWSTKNDFTIFGSLFYIGTALLIMLGITTFLLQSNFLYFLYNAGGVIFYSFYLIYDTQLIAGGKRH